MAETDDGGESAAITRASMERRSQTLATYLKYVAARKAGNRAGEMMGVSDLVQGAMLAAIRQLEVGRGPKPGQSVEHWLRERLLDVIRQERRLVRRSVLGLEVDPVDSATSPSVRVADRELEARLRERLGVLEEESRRMLIMRCVDGESLASIARQFGHGVPYVKKQLRKSLLKLKGELGESEMGRR